jgi:MYXO-CTERM domain-containing protein
MKRLLLGVALLMAAASYAPSAAAFCRTTICDPRYSCEEDPEICCIPDGQGCETNTAPISWPTSCVSYNVHEDGSEKLDIAPKVLTDVLEATFDSWLSVDCSGEGVSLAVDYRGYAECGSPEYNLKSKDRNANVWMFQDSGTSTDGNTNGGMVLDAAALAVTTVSFNEDTAEIYDVDVELLSSVADFTTSDESVNVDLASVVTHEAGHFLGLDHSLAPGATMASGYVPGSTAQRTLSEDDEAGVCAIYPEDRPFPGGKTCEPRGKYSPKCDKDGCGCRVVGQTDAPSSPALFAALFLGLAVVRRRRPTA